jgi:hypothetical protein
MRKLMEIWVDEKSPRFLLLKEYRRIFRIPPFKWETEEEKRRISLEYEEDAVDFLYNYFKGLKLKESKHILQDKWGTEIKISLELEGKKK